MTYRHVVLAIATAAIILTVAGCGNAPVATVGGVKITESEFNDQLIKAFGEDVLRGMIDRELIRQAAADRGIELTEEEIAQEIEQAKSQYQTEEQFQQSLAARDLSQEEWEEEVRTIALARKLALHGVEPTEEELRAFYEEHREQLGQPATVSFSEIVVASKEDAQKVLEELEGGDASFADLANRYSLSNTRTAGGERGEMPIEAITHPEIKEAATSLPIGEVSEPIEWGGSWMILKVRDRKEARAASLEADREQIVEQYRMANANSLRDILAEQMKKTNVNIVDPRFQRLNEVYTTMPEEIPQFGAEGEQAPLPDAPVVPEVEDVPVAPDSE